MANWVRSELRPFVSRHRTLRALVRAIRPSSRRETAQWRRIRAVVPLDVVQAGPFAGMKLAQVITGSGVPKRLGCYAVGLARRMPNADIWGFDTSLRPRKSCAHAAAINAVRIHIEGEADPQVLQRLVGPSTLVIVDVEGAEVDLLDPAVTPGLASSDILVETHDFVRPGATETLLRPCSDRPHKLFEQQPRNPAEFPVLAALTALDQQQALSESRPRDNAWLWLPATVR